LWREQCQHPKSHRDSQGAAPERPERGLEVYGGQYTTGSICNLKVIKLLENVNFQESEASPVTKSHSQLTYLRPRLDLIEGWGSSGRCFKSSLHAQCRRAYKSFVRLVSNSTSYRGYRAQTTFIMENCLPCYTECSCHLNLTNAVISFAFLINAWFSRIAVSSREWFQALFLFSRLYSSCPFYYYSGN